MTWVAVGAAAVTVVGGAIANNQSQQGRQGCGERADCRAAGAVPADARGLGAIPAGGRNRTSVAPTAQRRRLQRLLNSPDYQAAYSQGIGSIDRSAASRGSLFSGGHERDLAQFGSGLASQYLGNYRGSLMNLAALGSNAATQTGQFGANAATNSGNALAGMYQQRGDNNAQFAAGTAARSTACSRTTWPSGPAAARRAIRCRQRVATPAPAGRRHSRSSSPPSGTTTPSTGTSDGHPRPDEQHRNGRRPWPPAGPADGARAVVLAGLHRTARAALGPPGADGAISPQSAFDAESHFGQMDDNARKQLGQYAAAFSALPADQKAAAYPQLAEMGRSLGLPVPQGGYQPAMTLVSHSSGRRSGASGAVRMT